MTLIRNLIVQERSEEYKKVKKRERMDELRRTQNLNRSINEKRQKSLEVKLQEEEGRLSRTLYLEKKRLHAQKKTEIELLPLEAGL
jgi:Zn-finger domain-containing protein